MIWARAEDVYRQFKMLCKTHLVGICPMGASSHRNQVHAHRDLRVPSRRCWKLPSSHHPTLSPCRQCKWLSICPKFSQEHPNQWTRYSYKSDLQSRNCYHLKLTKCCIKMFRTFMTKRYRGSLGSSVSWRDTWYLLVELKGTSQTFLFRAL